MVQVEVRAQELSDFLTSKKRRGRLLGRAKFKGGNVQDGGYSAAPRYRLVADLLGKNALTY
jgi:hypothetical protein